VAWIVVALALIVLALDLAGERRVQEYLPALGRLPLVRDHELQRQPALPRGAQPALLSEGQGTREQRAPLDRVALALVIDSGDGFAIEADLAGSSADRERRSRSIEDLAYEEDRFLRREKEWVREVYDVLAGRDEYLDRLVVPPSYIPTTGIWAVAQRVGHRTKVLREILGESASATPASDRYQQRLALADEVAQRAAALNGLCEQWRGPIAEGDHWPGAPQDPEDRKSAATLNMMREYHEHHQVQTLAVFDRLVEEGVTEAKYRPHIQRPAHPNMVGSIPELLDNAVARLRISDKSLAAWLGQQMEEIRRLQRDLQEEIAPPNLGIGRHTQIELIEDAFWEINRQVAMRLQRDARPWVDYFAKNPDWFNSAVTRITADQHQGVVRLMGHTVDQLARIRERVS
jgi:hypothetical protein